MWLLIKESYVLLRRRPRRPQRIPGEVFLQYHRLQKVERLAWDDVCSFSFFSRLRGVRTVIFQLSGFCCTCSLMKENPQNLSCNTCALHVDASLKHNFRRVQLWCKQGNKKDTIWLFGPDTRYCSTSAYISIIAILGAPGFCIEFCTTIHQLASCVE